MALVKGKDPAKKIGDGKYEKPAVHEDDSV